MSKYGRRGQYQDRIPSIKHQAKAEVRAVLALVEGKDDKRPRPVPLSVPAERLGDTFSSDPYEPRTAPVRVVSASVMESTYQALRDFALARGVTRAQVTRAAIVAYLAGHSDPVFGTLPAVGRSVAPVPAPEGMLLALDPDDTDPGHAL